MTAILAGLTQPSATTCGAASLVAARMLLDPAYAELVATGVHPRTGYVLPGDREARFTHESLAMHRRTTGATTLAGGLQVPWPRALGTPPWAVAHQLSATGGPDLDPAPYAAHTVRLDGPGAARLVRAGLAGGRPVAVFVGDRWLPRHVVLAVRASGDAIGCYAPVSGRVVATTTQAFAAQQLRFGAWTHAWFVVAPAG